VLDELRETCANVARGARHVRIQEAHIPAYAEALPLDRPAPGPDPGAHLLEGDRDTLAAYWITLDAINFGSGWFPTLHKLGGRSGYFTIAMGLTEQFERRGPWTARELVDMHREEIAATVGQDPGHELMELFASSLRNLGTHVQRGHDGSFAALVDAAGGSAVSLVERLAGWECFADPFLKRAQIAAADVHRVGVARFTDLERLTLFADNLVPHVLRLDGILAFDPPLVERIERGELLEHGSPEEVEIRASAVHTVELIATLRPASCAADIDQLLWLRGQGSRYKASPRHRCRCTAY
jgi:hypothetical protein